MVYLAYLKNIIIITKLQIATSFATFFNKPNTLHNNTF